MSDQPSREVLKDSKCYACGRKVGKSPKLVDTRDGQTVYVGKECYEQVRAAGEKGYQPPKGGPRLYLIPKEQSRVRE